MSLAETNSDVLENLQEKLVSGFYLDKINIDVNLKFGNKIKKI